MQSRPLAIVSAVIGCHLLIAVTSAGNWNVPTQAKDLKNPTTRDASSAIIASNVYAKNCVTCHGVKAAGDGTSAKVEYDLRTIVGDLTDGELYWKITHGVGRMPSYAGVLSDKERWLVVNHLRELAAERDSTAQ